MKARNIIIPGIVGVGIGAIAAGAEIQPWQIDSSNPNQITVHVKRGDTLGEIAGYLDRTFGKYDDSADAARNLAWHLKDGSIVYSNCKNEIKNPNIIEAGRDITFRGKALEEIDPNYNKTEARKENYVPEGIENKTNITEKKIEIKTESKTNPVETPNPIARQNLSRQSELYKLKGFVLSGGIEYAIFEGVEKQFGGGMVLDVNAGYDMPEGFGFKIGGRMCEIDGDEYYYYRNSFFGFPHEAEVDLEALTMTELYAQFTAGSKNFRIFGGVGVKNVGNINAGASYGYWEGEGGIERDYEDRFKGSFGGIQILMPVNNNVSAGITGRYGKYKTNEGLELKEYSAGAVVNFRF